MSNVVNAQLRVIVKQINSSGNAGVKNVVDVIGLMFFSSNDRTNGAELWNSDATDPRNIMSSAGIIFFQLVMELFGGNCINLILQIYQKAISVICKMKAN